jgi:hypothetical protein
MRQTRHVKQATELLKSMDPIRQTLLRANAGQCGRDAAHCSLQVVRAVATMDCPAALAHTETSEASLYCAATLHRFGLPVDFAKLDKYSLPETCSCCNVPLWDPGMQASRADRIFIWQSHMGRCGGDGRRHQAHEAVKLAMQRVVLSCPDPAGCAFPKASILIEPAHLRQDKSRPGDIYAMGAGLYRKDTVMDVVITSALQRSCLTNTSKSSDYAIRRVETEKFRKDARSVGPIQNSSTKRFVPLALNHFGMRGGHFNAVLKEYATTLVTKPSGCPLMKGPFALSMKGALRKILNTWGARLTWTAQRQHAAQALHSMESFYSCSSFLSSINPGFAASGGTPDCQTGQGSDRLPLLDHVPESDEFEGSFGGLGRGLGHLHGGADGDDLSPLGGMMPG